MMMKLIFALLGVKGGDECLFDRCVFGTIEMDAQ